MTRHACLRYHLFTEHFHQFSLQTRLIVRFLYQKGWLRGVLSKERSGISIRRTFRLVSLNVHKHISSTSLIRPGGKLARRKILQVKGSGQVRHVLVLIETGKTHLLTPWSFIDGEVC